MGDDASTNHVLLNTGDTIACMLLVDPELVDGLPLVCAVPDRELTEDEEMVGMNLDLRPVRAQLGGFDKVNLTFHWTGAAQALHVHAQDPSTGQIVLDRDIEL